MTNGAGVVSVFVCLCVCVFVYVSVEVCQLVSVFSVLFKQTCLKINKEKERKWEDMF